MDYQEIFTIFWDFAISILENIQKIWDWLNDSITVGFDIELVDNPVFGFLINWFIKLLNKFSFTFTPIALFTGTTFIFLLGLALAKKFIPFT